MKREREKEGESSKGRFLGKAQINVHSIYNLGVKVYMKMCWYFCDLSFYLKIIMKMCGHLGRCPCISFLL